MCPQYEIPLHECETALEAWNERCEQIAQSYLSGNDVGDELLRLQVDYAKAHAVMRKHVRDCEICRDLFGSSVEGREYAWRRARAE